MRIAYAKLGRSIPLTKADASSVGGDIEVVHLMNRLVQEGHEVHLVGRNRANEKVEGVINHWAQGGVFHGCPDAGREVDCPKYLKFRDFIHEGTKKLPKFDAWVVWLGQHGSSLHPVPAVQDRMKGEYTSPLISLVAYGYPIVHMLNHLEERAIWLCPDPRNMIKFRDLWQPAQRDILAQYNAIKDNTFFDEQSETLLDGCTRYNYSAIEMLALELPNSMRTGNRELFGVLVNEGPDTGKMPRKKLVHNWLSPLPFKWDMYGHWSVNGQLCIKRDVQPISVNNVNDFLSRYYATITFPASSSGWATAKPWECFAAGCLCFKHPAYDDQGHIYGPAMPRELSDFLILKQPNDLKERLNDLSHNQWLHFARLQYQYLRDAHSVRKGGYAALEQEISKC